MPPRSWNLEDLHQARLHGMHANTMEQITDALQESRLALAAALAWEAAARELAGQPKAREFATRRAESLRTRGETAYYRAERVAMTLPETPDREAGLAHLNLANPREHARRMIQGVAFRPPRVDRSQIKRAIEEAKRQTDPGHPLGPMYTEG